MNRKYSLILLIILVIVIIFCVFILNKNKTQINEQEENLEYRQDENTGEYIIYDEESGEEKIRVENESEIQMYLDNPDFDIKL